MFSLNHNNFFQFMSSVILRQLGEILRFGVKEGGVQEGKFISEAFAVRFRAVLALLNS
jgi:hypothetical protein